MVFQGLEEPIERKEVRDNLSLMVAPVWLVDLALVQINLGTLDTGPIVRSLINRCTVSSNFEKQTIRRFLNSIAVPQVQ
jgi:hypothetical protein